MNIFLFFLLICSLSITRGQQCQGTFDSTINGQCSSADSCEGTLLAAERCEGLGCCVTGPSQPSAPTCITENDFDVLYKAPRALFLRSMLNYGINSAGICSNCQAKAAFLAIAATMTNDFENDEAPGTDGQFAGDDSKYGNTQPGDGSTFRQRGLFGLRGRVMYERVQATMPQFQTVSNPQLAALIRNSIDIASQLWKKPDLLNGPPLTQYADGSFYGFSMLWYQLYREIDKLAAATIQYSKFLRQLQCGGDLYPGQGLTCQYNSTHVGICSPDCIQGLEDGGEYCGCSGGTGNQCPNSPPHIRCCLGTCSQELKMDLGFVLDASGSVGSANYKLQLQFTKDLLARLNVGENKTHVGIINYSKQVETLTWLDTDYELQDKLRKVDKATYFASNTKTAEALRQANLVFSYERGLRFEEEGATPVLFVITDGASDDRKATIAAASVLKDKGIHLVSVGVGNELDLVELHAICTPPASENYFAMSDYTALEKKINQFTSKTCSEPAPVSENTTVTGEIGKDKYKFLKIKIVVNKNKIMITIKLFNGKVKLFYSFVSRNPKDPIDFGNYQTTTTPSPSTAQSSSARAIPIDTKAANDEITLVVDKPNEDVEYVYLGVKGVEEENKFEVKFDDCANVNCRSSADLLTMKLFMILMSVCVTLFLL